MHGVGNSGRPEGLWLWEGKMYHINLPCVSVKLSGSVSQAHHGSVGHVWLRRELRKRFSLEVNVMRFIAEVGRDCKVCQVQLSEFSGEGSDVMHSSVSRIRGESGGSLLVFCQL